MNKSLLLTFLVLFLINVAIAQVATDKPCSCNSRAIVRCGMDSSDEATKCRAEFAERCNLRYIIIEKCSNQISEKCITFKKGTREYQRCERSVSAQDCVTLLEEKDLYDCKCKKFSRALCGNCNSAAGIACRAAAVKSCKQKCGTKAPCNSKKRICMTPPKCDCKTQSKTKCSVAKDKASCYASEFSSCNKRCLAATKCYPVTCKNAGAKRCADAVATVCEKFSNSLKKYEQCVIQKTKRCLSYEQANCKKARRLYKYRTECDFTASTSCTKYEGIESTLCKSLIRKQCVSLKVRERSLYIRHSSTCANRAKLLCDAKINCKDLKACYKRETEHCEKRKHRREYIVPEECVERVYNFCGSKEGECYKQNIGKCAEVWLRRHCERKAYKECGCDVDCMKHKIRICNETVPQCWHNRDLCNDNNKCTKDVCDPVVGCLNIAKTCDDNNLCTTDVCHPDQGCIHTLVSCDDGVSCTVDRCDPESGKCEHKSDHTKCDTADKCTNGYCTIKGCKYQKDATCNKQDIPPCICNVNPCQDYRCEIQDDFSSKCIITDKICDDHKICTKDSCDMATGACIHTLITNTVDCPRDTQLCNDTLDCAIWSRSKDLPCKCEIATCDTQLGKCVAVPSKSKTCVPCDECEKACAPRNPCESSISKHYTCTKDKEGKAICNRPTNPCDDGSICTVDTCNLQTGECVHTFDCPDTIPSRNYTDCIQWSIDTKLYKQCKTAIYDSITKTCVIVDQVDSNFNKFCDDDHHDHVCEQCIAIGKCQSAECKLNENNKPVCVRTQKMCDDLNLCTEDYCDTTTGECVHKFVQNDILCPRCTRETELQCQQYAAAMNLASVCKKAQCNPITQQCEIVEDTSAICTKCPSCTPANKCEVAMCTSDAKGKPVCARSSVVCNDDDDCTTDSCDANTGRCVYTPVDSPKCHKCQFDMDCVAWVSAQTIDKCHEPFCNENGKCDIRPTRSKADCKKPCENCVALSRCDSVDCAIVEGVPTCIHTQTKCNDGNDCTQDYCDVATGKCVYNEITSDECQPCKVQSDCDAFAKKAEARCEQVTCVNKFCKTSPMLDTSKCPPPVCMNCTSSPCKTARCIYSKDLIPTCVYTETSCNDNNLCTIDSCDLTSGDCVNTYVPSSRCRDCKLDKDCVQYASENNLQATCQIAFCNEIGMCASKPNPDTASCKCKTDSDCSGYAKDNNLADQCRTPYCEAGTCKSKPIDDLKLCTPPPCRDCVASACQTVSCQQSNGVYFCQKTPTNCNDGIDCTSDYCDVKTNSCVHDSRTCLPCNFDTDCAPMIRDLKLDDCHTPKCHPKAKVCTVEIVPNKVCGNWCDLQCPATDKCHTSNCHFDNNNKLVCDVATVVNCDDHNDCTKDSCNPKTGCIHEFIPSDKCVKCTQNSDCSTYALKNDLNINCLTPVCIAEGQCSSIPNMNCVSTKNCTEKCATSNKCVSFGCSFDEQRNIMCNYVPKSCNDGKDCTDDSCDANTGLCVHTVNPKCGPVCKFDRDCDKWAKSSELADNCMTASCDAAQGMCVSTPVPDITKCPPKCDKYCPTNVCEKFTCAYDATKKVICTPIPVSITCDDKDDCTTDTCDVKLGCVNTFVESTKCRKCKIEKDCADFAAILGPCYSGSCNAKGYCDFQNDFSNPKCGSCPTSCEAPADKCMVSTMVRTKDSCTCEVKPKSCDDGIECTADSCDSSTGLCKNVFTPSLKCRQRCTVDAHCVPFSIEYHLTENCQLAKCNRTLGACVAVDDDKTNCKKCKETCKSNANCDDAQCVWIGNSYQCQHNPKNCDDGKSCTKDACNPSTGLCTHTHTCPTPPCNTKVDCASWEAANPQFKANCMNATCDVQQGACQVIPDLTCKTTCKQNSDCPPSLFGSVCDDGICVPNDCQFDSHCPNTDKDSWNYCKVCSKAGKKCCVGTTKCRDDMGCDDKNPCTIDKCLPEYGFCRNIARCDDNNECTNDVCTASSDGKSYTCSNPPRCCTQNETLIHANFVLLNNEEKIEWLGKCDKKKGCITCVVHYQCDDHNGCSYDSCEKQYCNSKVINNEWCDPKIATQPITYQSIPGLRDQLILAGYDIDKLAN